MFCKTNYHLVIWKWILPDFDILTTFCVLDETGNVVITYTETTGSLKQFDIPVYGNTKLCTAIKDALGENIQGYLYELSDHLGNVRAIIQDNYSGSGITYSYADYYPGGFVMSDRQKVASNPYRYGYQGEFAEKDQETGFNQFEARVYDVRIMRWVVPDPAGQFWSPYNGMGNNPISGIDPDGRQVGEWVINCLTGERTKRSDIGDDIGLDILYFANNDGSGIVSYLAKKGTWENFLISENSPLSTNAKIGLFQNSVRATMNKWGDAIDKGSIYRFAAYYAAPQFAGEFLSHLYFNKGDVAAALNDINLVNMIDKTGITGSFIRVSGSGTYIYEQKELGINLAANSFFGARGRLITSKLDGKVPKLMIDKIDFMSTFFATSTARDISSK